MYGDWSKGAYPFYRGDIVEGATGLWVQQNRGLFYFFPAVAFVLAGWPAFLKKHSWKAWVPFGGFVLVFILTSWWKYWDGGHCYGPRLLVSVLPLLSLGLVGALESKWMENFTARWFLYFAIVLGILVNGIGTTRYFWSLNQTPFQFVVPALFAPK
jgi:hypothetical protein